MNIFLAVVFCIIAYFLGSIPTAYIVAKLALGIDIRDYGSGNVGSTNALRVMGKKGGAIVLICDFLKAFIAAMLAKHFCGELVGLAAAIIAIIGHIFPVWLKFKGGKGVAAGLGGLVAILPVMMIFILIIWAVVVFLTGYVSLGSIVAALAVEVYLLVMGYDIWYMILTLPIVILIIYSHRSNLKRILNHQENRFRRGKEWWTKSKNN